MLFEKPRALLGKLPAAALHAAPTLLPVFESRMSVLLGNRGQRKLPSGREARVSPSHQVAALSRATMDRGPNGAAGTHQTELCSLCHDIRLVLEVECLTSFFPFPVVVSRTAPVPKYLKMHYVKEEIGDGKGVWECKTLRWNQNNKS